MRNNIAYSKDFNTYHDINHLTTKKAPIAQESNQNTLISFIIPIFNAQNYLKRSINSCLNQDLNNIQLIVVDDCSTDGSGDILKEYLDDTRVLIFKNEINSGPLYSRFKYLQSASGEWICFLDSDDFLDSDFSTNIKKFLESKKEKNKIMQCVNNDEKIKDVQNTCAQKDFTTSSLMDSQYIIYSDSTKDYSSIDSRYIDIIQFGLRFYPPSFKNKLRPQPSFFNQSGNILKDAFTHQTPPIHLHSKLYRKDFLLEIYKTYQDLLTQKIYMAEDFLASFIIFSHAKNVGVLKGNFYNYCDSSTSITRDRSKIIKKIDNINLVIDSISNLSSKPCSSNPAFKKSQLKAINILKSVIFLEKRYQSDSLRCYINAISDSLSYHKKIKNYIRLLLSIISFGKMRF